jgi:putative ABC transport system ATP-binding protein
MEEMIRIENLSKSYLLGELTVEVLHDINLAVAKGEFLSIMGPSGSGKSTLLYLIGGLDSPTAGSIRVNGRKLNEMGDNESSIMRRRDVGFVFQFYNLVPNLTVEENILLPVLLDGKRLKEYAEPLGDILDIVGLAARRRHTPRELSGGEQQRVAIARALINRPQVILADEPTGNLDTHTGAEVMELLAQINGRQGRTIIMVTHSAEAAGFAGRNIHVRDGRISE